MLILHKVIEELIFVSEENLVLLMECHNDMQTCWEALERGDKRREDEDYNVVQLRLESWCKSINCNQ